MQTCVTACRSSITSAGSLYSHAPCFFGENMGMIKHKDLLWLWRLSEATVTSHIQAQLMALCVPRRSEKASGENTS